MAYDEALAGRIRDLVGDEPNLTEQKMFGGLAFLIGGNMAVAASGQGGVLVRVDPDASDELVATTPASLMEMRGRSMRGWLRVGAGRREHREGARSVGRARHRVRPIAPPEGVADLDQVVMRMATSYFLTPVRLPGVSGGDIAFSAASPRA